MSTLVQPELAGDDNRSPIKVDSGKVSQTQQRYDTAELNSRKAPDKLNLVRIVRNREGRKKKKKSQSSGN